MLTLPTRIARACVIKLSTVCIKQISPFIKKAVMSALKARVLKRPLKLKCSLWLAEIWSA